jgi:hypothetical protein
METGMNNLPLRNWRKIDLLSAPRNLGPFQVCPPGGAEAPGKGAELKGWWVPFSAGLFSQPSGSRR